MTNAEKLAFFKYALAKREKMDDKVSRILAKWYREFIADLS